MQDSTTFKNIAREASKGTEYDRYTDTLINNTKKALIFNLIGFLISRTSILGGITPFGVSYYVALSGLRTNILLLLSTSLGLISAGATLSQVKYIIIALIYCFINKIYSQNNTRSINTALKAATITFIVGNIITFYKGFLLYDFIVNLFESFLTLIFVLIFSNVSTFINEEKKLRLVSNEQLISVTILLVLAASGLSGISIFNISIRNLLIITAIIIFSYKNGASIGAPIGLISGLIISMTSGTNPVIIGVYGFCGLISGIFKDLGKLGSIVGFILANAIITIYVNGSKEVLINLLDILLSSLIVLMIPSRTINTVSEYFVSPQIPHVIKKPRIERLKDITSQKLLDFSDAFSQLVKAFERIAEKRTMNNINDTALIFEQVAEKVCKECSFNTDCWTKNYYSTYQAMINMVEKLKHKGHIQDYDLEKYFREKCIRVDKFVNSTNNAYDIHRCNMIWQNRMEETRNLMTEQLGQVSQLIYRLAKDIELDIAFKTDLEKKIQIELMKNDIMTEEIMVIKNKYGKYEISIAHTPCDEKRTCILKIIPIVSSIVGRKMTKQGIQCSVTDKKHCLLRLTEQRKFRVLTGMAKGCSNNEKVSGDGSRIIEIKEGKCVLALSDGMGSGTRASKDSNAVLELLQKFLEAGFDIDISTKLINSILVLKSLNEAFVTIDLATIDLFTGEIELAKIGAASTFIKRGGRVEIVKSTSLPVGILEKVDLEFSYMDLEHDDVLIMITDGIMDLSKDNADKEDWIKEELVNMSTRNPQEIADELINLACQKCKDESYDDMTVLVARMSEII